jgi:cardiolipin synthase
MDSYLIQAFRNTLGSEQGNAHSTVHSQTIFLSSAYDAIVFAKTPIGIAPHISEVAVMTVTYGSVAGQLLTLHGLFILLGLSIYVISSHTLHLRRHPSAAIAWVVALVLLPYATLPIYLVFGIRKVKSYQPPVKRDELRPLTSHSDALAARTQQLAATMALPAASTYHQLNIHEDGTQALQSLRRMIDGAACTIDLSTFIFARDGLGNEIAQSLKRRAREGIQVKLLVDGVGAYLGGHTDFKSLVAAGVQVALFVPPLRSSLRGRTNLRNHRKMVITDSEWLWCGGRNFATEYFEGEATYPPWIDLGFDLHGTLALQAQQQFEKDWAFATGGAPDEPRLLVDKDSPPNSALGQLIASGPDQPDDTFYTLLISSFFVSCRRIMMVTPYFVPNSTLLMSLTLAARRGVTVDLLMPEKSNHCLADLARHRALRELTTAGVRVWFLPHMIHAKAVVVDDELAFVGTANLDERSLFLNYELMVSFYEPTDVKRFAEWIERKQGSAAPYQPRPLTFWREIREGMLLWLTFQL